MTLLVPKRIDTPELLDEHDAPHADVQRSLIDLQRINRWLGGVRIYRKLLLAAAGTLPFQSIVDVGTGSGDVLGSASGVPLRVGVDFKIEHLLHARDQFAIHRVVADASRLPFRSDAVDAVTSSHFFHHFTPEENAGILRESLRVARRAVIVNDTRRHYAPLLFVRLLGLLRLVGRITRFDAPASVLRAYTPGEAERVAASAGASRHQVVDLEPFRFGLLLWK